MATTPKIKRQLISYPGSKWRLAPEFVKLFPEHTTYVSPFCGVCGEFAFKPISKSEVINDIDHNIVSIFKVMQYPEMYKQLAHLLRYTPDSRQLYYECWDKLQNPELNLLDRAYNVYVIGQLGFKGVHPLMTRSYSFGLDKKRPLKTIISALEAWKKRMDNVVIECMDAINLIKIYDSADTFFFCDPPYVYSTRARCQPLYLHDIFNHYQFVKVLQNIKGKVMLCGYTNGLYDIQLMGWRRVIFPIRKGLGRKHQSQEVVWLNYDTEGNRLEQDFDLIEQFEQLPA